MLKTVLILLAGVAALIVLHGASRGWKAVTKKSLFEVLVVALIAVSGIFFITAAQAGAARPPLSEAEPTFANSEDAAFSAAQEITRKTAMQFGDAVSTWSKCHVASAPDITVVAAKTGAGSFVFSSYKKVNDTRYAIYANAGISTEELATCS